MNTSQMDVRFELMLKEREINTEKGVTNHTSRVTNCFALAPLPVVHGLIVSLFCLPSFSKCGS